MSSGGTQPSNFLRLAEVVRDSAESLVDYLQKHSYPEPSLAGDSSKAFWEDDDPEFFRTKIALVAAATELQTLSLGPRFYFQTLGWTVYELAALNTILEFNVPQKIPLDGEIAIEDLATAVGLDKAILLRIMRSMSAQYIGEEVETEVFRHTSFSRALTDAEVFALTRLHLDDCMQASVEMASYFKKPYSESSGESLFKHRWGMPMYDYFDQHPEKAEKFALGMQAATKWFDRKNNLLEDWLTANPSTSNRNVFIDVGGANGYVCMEMAKKFPGLLFVVEDIVDHQTQLPTDLKDRITFEKQNYYSAQRPRDPGTIKAYYTRQCLHNVSDAEAVQILKQLLPALKSDPEVRILVHDSVVPPPGILPRPMERNIRQIDLGMLSCVNAKERSEKDWKQIVTEADQGLKESFHETSLITKTDCLQDSTDHDGSSWHLRVVRN